MKPVTHEDGMLFMEYYKLWDTPFDNDAWTAVRRLRADGAFDSYEAFQRAVPRSSSDFGLVDRVLCSFEQAGVLMRNGLLHPALYFEGWAPPEAVWDMAEVVVTGMRQDGGDDAYKNMEWLAGQARDWRQSHTDAAD